jgi:hypothetical protein
MIDIETPETDAVWDKVMWRGPSLVACEYLLDHARKLEKERDEARAELAELRGKEACANCGTKCMWPPRYGQCRLWTPKQEPS